MVKIHNKILQKMMKNDSDNDHDFIRNDKNEKKTLYELLFYRIYQFYSAPGFSRYIFTSASCAKKKVETSLKNHVRSKCLVKIKKSHQV